MPPEDSRALHYGCALAATILITIFSFVHFFQAKRRKFHLQRCRRFYAACIGSIILSYVLEGTVTAKQNHFLQAQAHLIHTIILTVLCLRHPVPALQLACQAARISVLLILFAQTSYTLLCGVQSSAAENEPILGIENGHPRDIETNYGTESSTSDDDSDEGSLDELFDSDDEDDGLKSSKRLKEKGGWIAYLKDFSTLFPFLVPRNDPKVQCCYVITVLCLIAHRALNVLVPLQLGRVTDDLSKGQTPYRSLAIWLVFNLLSGGSGLGFIQELAEIPIKQFSFRQISNAAFAHVMSLGMDFHSERDSAEVMRAIEQGGALNTILEAAVTEIIPTFVDLAIAVFLLNSKFNGYVSLAMVVASVVYLFTEVKTSHWNTENRRKYTKAHRDEAKAMHQAVQGWQTVYYFNMFSYERHRFAAAIEKLLRTSRTWHQRRAYIDAFLELFVPLTFAGLSCLVFLEISRGHASTGDFVFLIQYWERLVWPLTYLSKQYRWLVSDLIDAERLLDLFQTKPTIVNKETAKDLIPVTGHVSFDHASFSYDSRKPVLSDIDFTASPGQTIALIGETGAGKSTIIKLLLRFYDATSGSIKIDNHDLRDITLSSLRNALGLVPQDPLLFNASIRDNLRYARLSASDADIESACQAAAIHSKILSFPDGYNTKVGENGVKLSGGEIQRLAIARVFLKDPPILILDEATSAVDTVTESEIQSVLLRLRNTRTTFVIAHRLSTVVGADRILVMHEGRIVESGTHQDLLRQGGRYKNLWTKQVEGVVAGKEQHLVDV
ncbi:MAG: hypothetical protein Q9227_001061 [Pyrenula ochraceoflavens]